MFKPHQLLKSVAALAGIMAMQPSFALDSIVDAASVEFATGSHVQMLRVGVQKDWNVNWFASNGKHLSGYWDVSVAGWRGNAHRNVPGARQTLTDIAFTPVFRYEHDDKKGWYAEGGIGVNRLSDLYDNGDNRLSTRFQFGDHIGAGYVFDNKWELGMKIQHFSNGGYKKPNSGVNFIEVKTSYHF